MSERKPTYFDLPLFAMRENRKLPELFTVVVPDDPQWIYWMKAILPPPPPRELTQRGRDEAAADAYLNKTAFNGGIGYLVTNAHIAGKYDERREILAALDAALQEKNNSKSMKWGVGSSGEAWSSAYAAIRARLEEQRVK